MKNLQSLLSEWKTKQIKVKDSSDYTWQWNQTQRNQLRIDFIKALKLDLEEAGFRSYRVREGVSIEIDNEELGSFYVTISPKFNSSDYDGETEESLLLEREAAAKTPKKA